MGRRCCFCKSQYQSIMLTMFFQGGDGADLVGGIVLDSFDTLAWGSFDQDFEGTSTSGERF